MADKVLEVTSAQINSAVKKANALTGTAPINLVDNKINLAIDNQTLQVNKNGELAANLDELGNEVNAIAGEVTALQADLTKTVTINTPQEITGKKAFNNEEVFIGGNNLNTSEILFKTANATLDGLGIDYTGEEAIISVGSSLAKTVIKGSEIVDENGNNMLTTANLPIATSSQRGAVKPDGTTITIKADGTISAIGGSGGIAEEQYGIKGDYATQYGILECPNGILTVDGMAVTLKQGVVMQCAGQDIKTTVASDMTHTIEATDDIDLFYAGGTILECGDVFYQETEPDNGVTNFLAWWKPSLGKWQFKSNNTGNVWKEATACRLAHIHTDGTTITRIDYIGNRILDDEIFLEAKNLKTINGQSLVGTGDITISGSGATLTPTVYALNDTIAGDANLDSVEVVSSSSDIVTVQVCTLDVPSGWYIVSYKGLLDSPVGQGGKKMTVFMRTYNTNTKETKTQAMSGHITAYVKNTYYLATTIMKIEENENIIIGLQQFTDTTRVNHTRGLVAMRIGDI